MKPIYQYADQTTGTNKDLGILRCDVSLGQMFPAFRRRSGLHFQGETVKKTYNMKDRKQDRIPTKLSPGYNFCT